MEERNTLLRNNLDTLYGAELAGAVCLVLLVIPIINLIAAIVALIAAIMIFVAMYRLRNVHVDYNTAFMLSVVNIPLTLIGGMMGGGMENVLDLISSLVSFGQTYYIIRATSSLLEEGGHTDVVEKGQSALRLYVVNLVVGLIASVISMAAGSHMEGFVLVLMLISLAVSIGAMVVFIKYLGEARNRF